MTRRKGEGNLKIMSIPTTRTSWRRVNISKILFSPFVRTHVRTKDSQVFPTAVFPFFFLSGEIEGSATDSDVSQPVTEGQKVEGKARK